MKETPELLRFRRERPDLFDLDPALGVEKVSAEIEKAKVAMLTMVTMLTTLSRSYKAQLQWSAKGTPKRPPVNGVYASVDDVPVHLRKKLMPAPGSAEEYRQIQKLREYDAAHSLRIEPELTEPYVDVPFDNPDSEALFQEIFGKPD